MLLLRFLRGDVMQELLSPFLVIIEWARTYQITIAGFSFTFFDMWMWCSVATVVIALFCYILER